MGSAPPVEMPSIPKAQSTITAVNPALDVIKTELVTELQFRICAHLLVVGPPYWLNESEMKQAIRELAVEVKQHKRIPRECFSPVACVFTHFSLCGRRCQARWRFRDIGRAGVALQFGRHHAAPTKGGPEFLRTLQRRTRQVWSTQCNFTANM